MNQNGGPCGKNGYKTIDRNNKRPPEHKIKPKTKRSDVIEELPPEVPIYLPDGKNYYLTDLISYQQKFKYEEIGGPHQEIPIIWGLINELNVPNSLLQIFKPLDDLLVTSTPKGFNYEIDFMQRLLLIPKAAIIDVRFEVKDGCKQIDKIREQLTNIEGELYPFIVEKVDFFSKRQYEKRFTELRDGLSDVALGFMLYNGTSFQTELNLELIHTPKVIDDILKYDGFNNVLERDLLITAYSMIRTLGYFKGSFRNIKFSDGSLVGKHYSFSTQPSGQVGNHLIIYEPSIGCMQDGPFIYQSMISKSLHENYHGQLNKDYSMKLTYNQPPAIADSIMFLDPTAPSNLMINRLVITRHYLNQMIDSLAKKIKVEREFPTE